MTDLQQQLETARCQAHSEKFMRLEAELQLSKLRTWTDKLEAMLCKPTNKRRIVDQASTSKHIKKQKQDVMQYDITPEELQDINPDSLRKLKLGEMKRWCDEHDVIYDAHIKYNDMSDLLAKLFVSESS